MVWLVELATTEHTAKLNIETVCLMSIFSHYLWAIFVQTIFEILHRKLQVMMLSWNHWAVSFYFIPMFSSCLNSHVLYYLPYPHILTSCLNICCYPCVLHGVLEPNLEAACNTIKFFEHRQVRKLLSNSTLHQESNLECCLLP